MWFPKTVGTSICGFVKKAFRDQWFPDELNQVMISLIPKVKHPESASQFRPIALANVVSKIITKVVANRLKQFIPKVVDQSQCAFTPGRQSSENIIIAQEIIHTMNHKRGKTRMMVVKVDLEKAYDRVRWLYLREVIRAVGFNDALTNLVMHCVTSSSLSLLWNGDKLGPFKPSRGIRQGDPLAPYLFLLCMDALSQLIKDAVSKGD